MEESSPQLPPITDENLAEGGDGGEAYQVINGLERLLIIIMTN